MNTMDPPLMSPPPPISPGGLLALASCSSHVPAPMFNELCEEAVLGGARRQATVLAMQVCVSSGSVRFPLATLNTGLTEK